MKPKHFRADEGRVNRELRDLRKQAREQAAGKRLQAATILKGGLTVKDGGGITVEDGGSVAVEGGGRVYIRDGGDLWVMFPDNIAEGQQCVIVGDIFRTADGSYDGTGILVQTRSGADIVKLLTDGTGSRGTAEFGATASPLEEFGAVADLFFVQTTDGISLDGGSVGVQFLGTAFAIDGLSVNNSIVYLGAPTTGAAANLNYDLTNGKFRVVTSSLRYKQDVEEAAPAGEALLKAHGSTWRDRNEVEDDPDTPNRYVGFIAEQLHDLGLGEYLVYDEEGRPEAVQYDRLTVPLLQIVQDLVARVEALEAR